MRFIETPLPDTFLIEPNSIEDERGRFTRIYCQELFQKAGIDPYIVQMNHSVNPLQGTLRGMHYQTCPKEETKIVRCIRGSLFDVVLDLRSESPTYQQHYGAELSERNQRMMVVPRGCAHGFVTLEPNTELIYLVSAAYSKERERGVRWDDPSFSIAWPVTPSLISEKDQQHPNWCPA